MVTYLALWGEVTMIRVPPHREPTHPGEMLLEEFLKPMALTQRRLAEGIHVPYQRINELVNRKRGMTPSTALRMAKFFGTSADFWVNLQLRRDLYQAAIAEAEELTRSRSTLSRAARKSPVFRGTVTGR